MDFLHRNDPQSVVIHAKTHPNPIIKFFGVKSEIIEDQFFFVKATILVDMPELKLRAGTSFYAAEFEDRNGEFLKKKMLCESELRRKKIHDGIYVMTKEEDETPLHSWKVTLYRKEKKCCKIYVCSCIRSEAAWMTSEPSIEDDDSEKLPPKAIKHKNCIDRYEGKPDALFRQSKEEFWPKDESGIHIRVLARPKIRIGLLDENGESSIDAGRRADFAVITYESDGFDDELSFIIDEEEEEGKEYSVEIFRDGKRVLGMSGSEPSDRIELYDHSD